jgi:hypothetical protein
MKQRALPCLAAAALFACSSEQVDPSLVTYDLVRTATDTLPYRLQTDDGCQHLLRGGKVEFYGDGRYRSSYDVTKTCPGERAESVPVPGVDGRVSIRSDTAHFADVDGNSTGQGILTADSLLVRGMLHTLIYKRAPVRRP